MEQRMQEQADRLRSQMWRYLEAGEWHGAMLVAEHLSRVDAPAQDARRLAEAARALAMISDDIRLNEPIDPDVLVRLEKIARAWPRLAEARSFQTLVQAVEKAVTTGQPTPAAPSAAATATFSAQVTPSAQEPRRSLLRRIARPTGWAGIAATVACVLVVLLVFDSMVYYYLREQPISPQGPEAKLGSGHTLPPWHGLIDLQGPVDTIILGDSTARVDLVTGPIADRLGGSAINLGNNAGSSLLMDAWMLQYYLDKFGPPRNVILLRNCHGYEYEHDVEFMSVVPLEWGYWDRLGTAPVWKDSEELKLFASKYGVLNSSSDILSYRLIHPLDLLAQPYSTIEPVPFYSRGSTLGSELDDFRRGNTVSTYSPFQPSADSLNAMTAMSDQARSLGFQLYIAIGPEWDEAYNDPDRQAKVSGMEEWLAQFTDSQYVHLVLTTPMVFRADQMQNINHLRPGAEKQYTEAMLGDIVAIQNPMAAIQAKPVELTSAVLDKSQYAVGEQPTVTLSLTGGTGIDTTASAEGDVSCLIRWAGKSDAKWVIRAPATSFVVQYGGSTEISLTLSVGKLSMVGSYDLVVFVRQNVGNLSYETRIELPNMIKVKE